MNEELLTKIATSARKAVENESVVPITILMKNPAGKLSVTVIREFANADQRKQLTLLAGENSVFTTEAFFVAELAMTVRNTNTGEEENLESILIEFGDRHGGRKIWFDTFKRDLLDGTPIFTKDLPSFDDPEKVDVLFSPLSDFWNGASGSKLDVVKLN